VAYQAVVNKEKIKEFLRGVTKQKGEFYLAMLVQTSPDLPQRWTLVVSARWIDSSGLRNAVSYLSSQLEVYLDRNSLSTIDRISPLAATPAIIEKIRRLPKLALEDPEHTIRNWQIGDWFIHYGYLFVASTDGRRANQQLSHMYS